MLRIAPQPTDSVLLTACESLHPAVAQWLADHGIATTVLLGGTAALSTQVEMMIVGDTTVVSDDVQRQLDALDGSAC